MSTTQEPEYLRRRKNAEQKKIESERAEEEARRRKKDFSALVTLIKDIRHERRQKNESERKRGPLDWIAAIAACIAVILSAASLGAFWLLTTKADTTADNIANIYRGQLHMMYIDERPWIKTEAAIGSDLVYVKVGNGKIEPQVTINLTLTNTGKTPAFSIWFPFGLIDSLVDDPSIKQSEQCSHFRDPKFRLSIIDGPTLFPQQTLPLPLGAAMSPDEISGEKTRFPKLSSMIMPVLWGCIAYRTIFGGEWHETAYAYDIIRKDGTAIDIRSGTIKAADLMAVPSRMFDRSFFAN